MAEVYQGMVDAANSENKEAIQESTSRETYEKHVTISKIDYGMQKGNVSTEDYFNYTALAKYLYNPSQFSDIDYATGDRIERSTGYRLVVFIDQPGDGSYGSFQFDTKSVGHAFLSLQNIRTGETLTVGVYGDQSQEGSTRNLVLGGKVPSLLTSDAKYFLKNPGAIDVIRIFEITQLGYETAVDKVNEAGRAAPDYSLSGWNCTRAVISFSKAAGIDISTTSNNWLTGSGPTPYSLGKTLANYPYYSPLHSEGINEN